MTRAVIVLGGGGHARSLVAALRAAGRHILGCCAPHPPTPPIPDVPWLGEDDHVLSYPLGDVELANGIGSVGRITIRRDIYERFRKAGYDFCTVIHPAAYVDETAEIRAGSQIMAGAIIQTGAVIGENVLVNTGAIIEHDCRIGAHCHIAPGAVLSGEVLVNDATHVGAGAVIIQGMTIGERTVVGAGAVVVKNISADCTAVGNPATSRGR